MKILPASPAYFQKALDLLSKNGLPTDDLSPETNLFISLDNDLVTGTIAAEFLANDALLRSLSVDEERRKSGTGIRLVLFIENFLSQNGVENIFLITTTAESFFLKRGYLPIKRDEAPLFIRNGSQFTSLCPASATVMKKSLV